MSVITTLQKLPDMCAATLPGSGQPILIKAGVMGYYPAPPQLDVQRFNQRNGITPEQMEAMLCGSMFGWDVPAADPDTWKNDPKFQSKLREKDIAPDLSTVLKQARSLILDMGKIIRGLDDNHEWLEFWTQDGDYLCCDSRFDAIDAVLAKAKGDAQ